MKLLSDFFFGMTPRERDEFARAAGTTARYIRYSLLANNRRDRRVPRSDQIDQLVRASRGKLTYGGVLGECYPALIPELKGCDGAERRPRPIDSALSVTVTGTDQSAETRGQDHDAKDVEGLVVVGDQTNHGDHYDK